MANDAHSLCAECCQRAGQPAVTVGGVVRKADVSRALEVGFAPGTAIALVAGPLEDRPRESGTWLSATRSMVPRASTDRLLEAGEPGGELPGNPGFCRLANHHAQPPAIEE